MRQLKGELDAGPVNSLSQYPQQDCNDWNVIIWGIWGQSYVQLQR